jgi:hypothetical protein
MGNRTLEIVVPVDALDATKTAELCLDLIGQQQGAPVTQINLYHSPVKLDSLSKRLKKRKSFHIDGDGFDVRFGTVQNYQHACLIADGVEEQMERIWIDAIAAIASLISARTYDDEYEHWQNAEDPLQYQTAGRSMEGLPMKSNELPPPLDQMVVDTSHNPGRRILREGYVEAIGHRMWLGPEFFRLVPGAQRDTLLSESWLQTVELENDVLELTVQDDPFVDDATAETQNRLRAMLFP